MYMYMMLIGSGLMGGFLSILSVWLVCYAHVFHVYVHVNIACVLITVVLFGVIVGNNDRGSSSFISREPDLYFQGS